MFQYATVNTETNVDRSSPDRTRMFVAAAVAVVLLVPLVLLVLKRSPTPAAVPAASASAAPGSTTAASTTAASATAASATPAPASALDQDIELARTLLNAGKPRESLVPLERAQRADPNSFAVYNNRCVAYGMLGQRNEAVAACVRALQIDPDNQLGKNNLAWVAGLESGAKP